MGVKTKAVSDILTVLAKLPKPDVLVTAYPTRFHRVIQSQNRQIGVLQYWCEKNDVQFYENTDSFFKKQVFGKGVVEKKEIIERYQVTTEHEADACMFAEGFANFLKTNQ